MPGNRQTKCNSPRSHLELYKDTSNIEIMTRQVSLLKAAYRKKQDKQTLQTNTSNLLLTLVAPCHSRLGETTLQLFSINLSILLEYKQCVVHTYGHASAHTHTPVPPHWRSTATEDQHHPASYTRKEAYHSIAKYM